jgi:hypothetical protein
VFGPRLGRLLTETAPAFEFFAADDEARAAVWRRESPADALREWSQLRAALMTRIAGLGTADWGRIGTHGVHGPYGMTEMVRAWVEHDLAHRRQMVRALGEPV